MAHSRRERKAPQAPQRLILDSGAVIAASQRDRRALAYLKRATEAKAWVSVPAVVVAETIRGGPRDAGVNQVLSMVQEIAPTKESVARIAGRLLASTSSNDTIDALVVAEAVAGGGGELLTGDVRDMQKLAARHPEVRVQPL